MRNLRTYIIIFIMTAMIFSSGISSLAKDNNVNYTKNDIYEKIKKIQALPDSAEIDGIKINERFITIDDGEKYQLKLTDSKGDDVQGVSWYLHVPFPEGFYEASETDKIFAEGKTGITITDKGLVEAKKQNESAAVWAEYKGGIYRCIVKVRKMGLTRQRKARKRVEEIIQEEGFYNIKNDLDKIYEVHNYIVKNVTASSTGSPERYNLYGAIIDKEAVCYGYAKAFGCFMSKLNIPCEIIQGETGTTRHAWNAVKVGDEWYYVDTTHDDVGGIRYNYCVVDKNTISRTHKFLYDDKDKTMGKKYNYYGYKKNGMLINEEEEIESVLKAIIESSNNSSVNLKLMVADKCLAKVDSSLKNMQNVKKSTKKNSISMKNGYTELEYRLDLSDVNIENIKFNKLTSFSENNKSTTHIKMEFDKKINDFNIGNIQIEGATKIKLEEEAAGIYKISIGDILKKSGENISVTVQKRGYKFDDNKKECPISIVKEETPKAIFKAIDNKNGYLENIESNMQYSIGEGIWNHIEDKGKVHVGVSNEIKVQKKAKEKNVMDSDIQIIKLRRCEENIMAKGVDTTEGKNNGKIINTSKRMEYREESESNWKNITSNELTGLGAGEYRIRYKADGDVLASSEEKIIIKKSVKSNQAVGSGKSNVSSGGSASSGSSSAGSGSSGSGSSGSGSSGGESSSDGGGSSSGGESSSAGTIDSKASTTNEPSELNKNNENQKNKQKKPIEKVEFKDVPKNHWAEKSIAKSVQRGIFKGVGKNKFEPNREITRQEVWMIISRLKGESFTTFEEATKWCVENNISDGKNKKLAVTREEFVTMIWRMSGKEKLEMNMQAYKDFDKVSEYAKTPMKWAVKNKIIKGITKDEIYAKGYTTRAQIARIIENMEK